ncbi:diguanylate cyclase (GGDEF)-like protein [Sporosarcina luteola]|nr:diguanylate cyclase (GGDEF)-like protein [Sporosarcina luteola]
MFSTKWDAVFDHDTMAGIVNESFLLIHLSPEGKIVEANESFLQLFHYEIEDIYLQDYYSLMNSCQDGPDMWNMLGRGVRWRGESCLITKWGDLKWLQSTFIPVMEENGELAAILGLHVDYTDQKNATKWKTLAFQNELTHLPNRRELLLSMERYVCEAEQRDSRFAVLFMDINQFKSVNDMFGHHVGDMLLIEVGKRLSSKPYQGQLFHVSGDEFIMLVEDVSTLDRAIETIFSSFENGFELDDVHIKVSTSIGISLFPDHSKDPLRLIQLADQAMFEAKAGATNQYRFVDLSLLER